MLELTGKEALKTIYDMIDAPAVPMELTDVKKLYLMAVIAEKELTRIRQEIYDQLVMLGHEPPPIKMVLG